MNGGTPALNYGTTNLTGKLLKSQSLKIKRKHRRERGAYYQYTRKPYDCLFANNKKPETQ